MLDHFSRPATNTLSASLDADGVARLLADSLQDGLCVLGMNETILFVNRAFRSRSGCEEADLLGHSYLELIHPGDLERVAAALRAAFKGQPGMTIAHRKLSSTSGPSWCTSSWSPLRDQEGQQVGVLGRESSAHGRTPVEEVFLHDITDRRRTELALRQSEERYRRISEAVTDYIYTVSIDGTRPLRSVNCPVCEVVTGYTAAEFDQDPGLWLAITAEEDREQVRNHSARILAGDDPGPIRHRIFRKDGSLRWVHRLPVLHRNSSGAVASYDVLVRDITERCVAEEALRESELRFRHMADLLPQPLYETDTRGLITFANKAGLRMFGYTEEDLRAGIQAADMLAPEDRERARANIRRVLRGEAAPGHEYSALLKNGGSFPAIIFSAPITKAGRIAGLRGIVIDITERVQAEGVLRESALKFRQLAAAISEVFFIKDARTRRTLYISPAYESVWGKSCRSFYENPESFRECVHPDDRALVADVLGKQGLGMPTELEYRIIRPDGAIRWIRSKTFPVRDESGSLYRIVGVAEDITDRRNAEAAMRNHAAQLQALSSRLVDVRESERRSIARELHDEIGQIATGIKLGLDLLSRTATPDTRDQIGHLQVMAAELISEVRNLSLGLRPSMLDDLGLLPALAWLFKRFGDQTGVAVNFTHCGIARRFPADMETVIYRATQEAITNAARHADVDEISVGITADKDAVALTITDQGAGFVPDEVLSATKSIGLFGMRERVDSIGGSLSITSAPTAGTSISIHIPLTDTCARDIDHGDHDHHS